MTDKLIPGTSIPRIDNLSIPTFTQEYVYIPIKSFTVINGFTKDKYIQNVGESQVVKKELNGKERTLFPYRITQMITTTPYTTATIRDLKPEEIIIVFTKGKYNITPQKNTDINNENTTQLQAIPLTQLVQANMNDTLGYAYPLNPTYNVAEYYKFQRAFYHKFNRTWKELCINHWNDIATSQGEDPNGV